MVATHTIQFEDMSVAQICNHFEHKQYLPIKDSFVVLDEGLEDLKIHYPQHEKLVLIEILFRKLRNEMEQTMRNDLLVLFPILKKKAEDAVLNHFPLQSIRDKNKRILNILNKVRLVCENYVRQPCWDATSKAFFEEMYNLDKQITESILLKENLLFPRLKLTRND